MKTLNKIKNYLSEKEIEFTATNVYSNLEELSLLVGDGLKLEIDNPTEKNFYEVILYHDDKLIKSETFYSQKSVIEYLSDNI